MKNCNTYFISKYKVQRADFSNFVKPQSMIMYIIYMMPQ